MGNLVLPMAAAVGWKVPGDRAGGNAAHQRVQRGGATPGEFEERRRALTGVMGPAHQVIWEQGQAVAGPGRHVRPGGR